MKKYDISNLAAQRNEKGKKTLRGKRLSDIRSDLKDKSLSDKEKVLRYSNHIEWFLDCLRSVLMLQESANSPGVWNKSPYSHGVLNGIIMSLAVFMEEQHEPPYKKAPASYTTETGDVIKKEAFAYIERLEKLIACVIRSDEHGPFGYGHHENPWDQWAADMVDAMTSSMVESDEMKKVRTRVQEFLQNIHESDR